MKKKSFDKIWHPFIVKSPKKPEMEGMFHNIMKSIFDKPIANVILSSKNWNHVLLKPGPSEWFPVFQLFFNLVLHFLIHICKAREINKMDTHRKWTNQIIPVWSWYDPILKRPEQLQQRAHRCEKHFWKNNRIQNQHKKSVVYSNYE
jgi:hypothetical protein